MPQTITFGEIEAVRLDAGWEFPAFPGTGPQPAVPLPGGRACLGPDPGYHIASTGPAQYGVHDFSGGPRELGALRFAGAATVSRAYYGTAAVPPGAWRFRLRVP